MKQEIKFHLKCRSNIMLKVVEEELLTVRKKIIKHAVKGCKVIREVRLLCCF